jgi:hypothetical protein
MAPSKAHQVWIEQCEAAQTIRARYGLNDAFSYLVGEKLLNFAEAASRHPEFARELPPFVAAVRRLFTLDEIETQLARIENEQEEDDSNVALKEDDPLRESPTAATERARRFDLVKELLTANVIGTS